MVCEEPDGVDEREVERLAGRSRPERGAERDEEVVTEPRRVALLGDVAGEAPLRAAGVVESPAAAAQEAGDLERQPRERRAAARVLEVVPVAGDREAHLRRLRAHAQLAEETDEVRVGVLVVDDEAGVEPSVRPATRCSTVFEWPPARSSRSNSSTSWAFESAYAAPRPEIPVPITAIFIGIP